MMAATALIPEGHVGQDAYVLLSGWAGLNASLSGMPEQSIAALTDVQVAKFEGARLINALQKSSGLWLAFLWSDTKDRFIMEERVASIGRSSAYERLPTSSWSSACGSS